MVAKTSESYCWKYRHQKKEYIIFSYKRIIQTEWLQSIKCSHAISGSFIISGYVPLQPNDQLRKQAENLSVIFRIDKHNNIISITAYGESDEK